MLSIGVVARQTGLDISTLRKWESRYGFPQPVRRDSGQRSYRTEDVTALQAARRRIAAGEQVGKVIRSLTVPSFDGAMPANANAITARLPKKSSRVALALKLVVQQDFSALMRLLDQWRQQSSMLEFIQTLLTPLTIAVGDAWARGDLPIRVEHFYSTLVERLLFREIESRSELTTQASPRLLLVTLAGEKHTLGVITIHALLAEAGIPCVRLSSDLPVSEIVALCHEQRFSAVGVSASVHYSRRLLRAQIELLRKDLPADVELWLGGGGIDRVSVLPAGSKTFNELSSLIEAARMLVGSPDSSVRKRKS